MTNLTTRLAALLSFTPLFASHAYSTTQTTSLKSLSRPTSQTVVVFQDKDVPQFWVIEKNGKKKVVIDSSHLKTQVKTLTK